VRGWSGDRSRGGQGTGAGDPVPPSGGSWAKTPESGVHRLTSPALLESQNKGQAGIMVCRPMNIDWGN
jgi:hypothetical protein